jgi:hypothetical protein
MEDERTRKSFRIPAPLAIICLSAGTAACASVTPYNPEHLPPAQMSRISEICDTVMGLPAGLYTHYLACEESLSRSLATRRKLQRPPHAMVAQADHSLAAPLPAPPVKSYFSASNDEIHRREQKACVAIGEDPATIGSARCVVDLAGYLFDADNPIPRGRW